MSSLVRHLVDDDVVPVPVPRCLHVLEGEHHRTTDPGLPAAFLFPRVLDSGIVHVAPAGNETGGIDDHGPPRCVGVEPEGQDRHACLSRDDHDVKRFEGLPLHRLDGLCGNEARREIVQPCDLRAIEPIEDRKALDRRGPFPLVDCPRASPRPHRVPPPIPLPCSRYDNRASPVPPGFGRVRRVRRPPIRNSTNVQSAVGAGTRSGIGQLASPRR